MAEVSQKTKKSASSLMQGYGKFLFLDGGISSTEPKSKDSATKIAGKILAFHVKQDEKETKDREIENNFKKQRQEVLQKRHDDILGVLNAGTKKAEEKKKKKKKDDRNWIEKIFGKSFISKVIKIIIQPLQKLATGYLLMHPELINKFLVGMVHEMSKPFGEIVDDVKIAISNTIKDTVFDTEFLQDLLHVEPKTPDDFPFPENPPEYELEDSTLDEGEEAIEGEETIGGVATARRVPRAQRSSSGGGAGGTGTQAGSEGGAGRAPASDSSAETATKISAIPTSGGANKIASSIIAKEEGLPAKGKAYWDPPNQKNLVSVGYGHQIKPEEYKQGFIQAGDEQVPIKGDRGIDTVLTPDQAKKVLEADLPKYEQRAAKPLGEAWLKLSDVQKASLISYAYNTGSTVSLVNVGLKDAILSGNMKEAENIIRDKGIRTAGGVENKALVARRKTESLIFASGAKDSASQVASTPPKTSGDSLNKASTQNTDAKKEAAQDKQKPINVIAVNNNTTVVAGT